MPDPDQRQLTIHDAQMRAAIDPDFRAWLLADPGEALAAAGVAVPAGITVDTHEATARRIPFVIPPAAGSDAERHALAGQAVRLRAAADPAYRRRLLADPRAVLGEAGVPVAREVELVPIEALSGRLDVVVPPLMDLEGELADDALAQVGGGALVALATGVAPLSVAGSIDAGLTTTVPAE